MQTIFTAAELKENYQILLRLLGQLQTENDYLQAAMDNLSKIPNNAIPGDIANQAKAIAISELVEKSGENQSEVIRNLSKIIRRFKTVSFSGKRSLKNPINGGSYGIRNPANSHSIYLLSL